MSDTIPASLVPEVPPTVPNGGIIQAAPIGTVKANLAKVVFQRAWRDIEPKLAAGLLGGTAASAIIAEAANVGFPLDPGAAALLTALLSFIGGYIKSSTGQAAFEGSIKN